LHGAMHVGLLTRQTPVPSYKFPPCLSQTKLQAVNGRTDILELYILIAVCRILTETHITAVAVCYPLSMKTGSNHSRN